MSFTTINQCANDSAFTDRVMACIVQQSWNNPDLHDTELAKQTRGNPGSGVSSLAWVTAVDYEAEYEYAVNAGNPNPGGDAGVITDGNIQASVVTHWPKP